MAQYPLTRIIGGDLKSPHFQLASVTMAHRFLRTLTRDCD